MLARHRRRRPAVLPTSSDRSMGCDMDDVELAEIVARVGCLYVKRGLSPPFHLRDAARRWMGLSQDEIIEVLELHFAEHRRRYTCGSGDGLFYLVEAAIRAAWQAKHPPIAHADDEPGEPL